MATQSRQAVTIIKLAEAGTPVYHAGRGWMRTWDGIDWPANRERVLRRLSKLRTGTMIRMGDHSTRYKLTDGAREHFRAIADSLAGEPIRDDQKAALKDYQQWFGYDKWKQQLRADWMRAGSSWSGPWHLLQQLRNTHGPAWLDAY